MKTTITLRKEFKSVDDPAKVAAVLVEADWTCENIQDAASKFKKGCEAAAKWAGTPTASAFSDLDVEAEE